MAKLRNRQGDVSIFACPIPKDATPKKVEGRLVLAHGEVTGHAHAFDVATIEAGDVEAYEKDGVLYLRVINPSDLKHEEHATHTLPPGEYRVGFDKDTPTQREYTPEEIRRVLD
jgi:hypothetical protein